MKTAVHYLPRPAEVRRMTASEVRDSFLLPDLFIPGEFRLTLTDADRLAAVVIEPIQGEGGYLPAPAEYLQDLQRICRKYGILLICDEVQSGMGRTGKWWAHQHAGIEPDIITVAKGVASGMPLGVMIARASVMNWTPGAHASTFGGNPVSVAASLATIELLEQGLVENAARTGAWMMDRMRDWPARFSRSRRCTKSSGWLMAAGMMRTSTPFATSIRAMSSSRFR